MPRPEEQTARLRAILETAVDGIITIEPCGRIESANPAACEIFGYTPDEMIGEIPMTWNTLDMVAAARDIGVDHILIDPVARGGFAGRLDAVRAFMTEVAPAVG